MARTPEQEAREAIDQMLDLAGWNVQDCREATDPGILAQEIVDDLEAVLEQFREIGEDLGEEK